MQNLNDARIHLWKAFGKSVAESSVYETEPWGYEDKFQYYNQILLFSTCLQPLEILEIITEIEKKMGRTRNSAGYESRIIDIDILFYGQMIFDSPELQIPHPRIQLRKFTLIPLAEISPEFTHPIFKLTVYEMLNHCGDKLKVQKIARKE
jgi:2-amino-4-hydroxy-6-hydroxymethyldihydropteridine diphosphokinase